MEDLWMGIPEIRSKYNCSYRVARMIRDIAEKKYNGLGIYYAYKVHKDAVEQANNERLRITRR